MSPFEYAIGLIAIVLGLAITDMGVSLHRLLRHRASVTWDLRVIFAALFAFLLVANMWFNFWSIRERVDVLGYLLYMSLVAELAIAFLLAASALPDEAGPGFDLRSFYGETARQFWTLVTLFGTSFFLHWAYFSGFDALSPAMWSHGVLWMNAGLGIVAPAILAIWPRNKPLHLLLVPVLIAWSLWGYAGESLTL